MIHAVEMVSYGMIYLPSFINMGSRIQKLLVGATHLDTQRQQGDPISLLLFLKNKEIRLIKGL
jgi:hypothetical protein